MTEGLKQKTIDVPDTLQVRPKTRETPKLPEVEKKVETKKEEVAAKPKPTAEVKAESKPEVVPVQAPVVEPPKERKLPSGSSIADFGRLRQVHTSMSMKAQPAKAVEKRRFFFDDLKVRGLPKGEAQVTPLTCEFKEKLFVVFENSEENIKSLEFLANAVHDVIAAEKATSYEPQKGEMVLGKFEGEFYRAHCTAINDEGFVLYFVDYGNFSVVEKKDIRPFDSKLNVERFVHTCFVENLPNEPNERLCELLDQPTLIFETLKRSSDGVYIVSLIGL